MATDTFREKLRDYRARVHKVADGQGVRVDDIRREQRDEQTVAKQVTDVMNTTVPIPRRALPVVDNPVLGSFDGINREFTLSQQPGSADNIVVGVVTQSTGTVNFPTRTDHPAPGSGSWWFDGNMMIRVGAGDIQSALDRVFAVYLRKE